MSVFEITELPFSSFIASLAEQMDTTFTEECGEFTVEIPNEYGKGKIRGINFPNGVGLVQYECQFAEDTEIHFTSNQIHPLKFVYCVEGSMSHSFERDEEKHELVRLRHIMAASSSNVGHRISFNKNSKIKAVSLEIDRKVYQSQIMYDLLEVEFHLYKLLADVNAINRVFHDGFYSLKIADIINDLERFEETGIIRTNFIGSKALEIFSYMLLQFSDDMKKPDERLVIRAQEAEIIRETATYIKENLENLGSIDEIANEMGLSKKRLQSGFRILYHKTVNQYIIDQRLSVAIGLMRAGRHNVSEVVYAIGLSSRSHFAKLFKQKYGVSPKDYINKIK